METEERPRMGEPMRTRDATVERYCARLRSNIHRSADRATRRGPGGRPRPDNQIMAAWVLRGAKRAGACPLDDPDWVYDPGWSGPAIQTATVRCLIPTDDDERRLFSTLRVPSSTHVLRYFHPADIPPLTAVWHSATSPSKDTPEDRDGE